MRKIIFIISFLIFTSANAEIKSKDDENKLTNCMEIYYAV